MQGVKSSDWLSTNFGVRFRYNALGDLNTSNIVTAKESFGITEGVKSVSMHAGSTLAITNPEKAKGIVYTPEKLPAKSKWSHAVDQGIYNGGGKEEGPYVAISKVGKGKAAFIGDSSLVEDSSPKYVREDTGEKKKTYDGFKEQDNSKLLNNITTWMSKDNDGKSLKASGVTLDAKTKLLDFEKPANSTEPEKNRGHNHQVVINGMIQQPSKQVVMAVKRRGPQPNTPDDNTPTNQNGKVSFDIPQDVSVNEPFEIAIHLKGFEANQTLENLRVGIYKEGGQQIGQFSNGNGAFSPPGYSTLSTVKTDENGDATIQINAKVLENTEGSKIRLKLGDKTLITTDFK